MKDSLKIFFRIVVVVIIVALFFFLVWNLGGGIAGVVNFLSEIATSISLFLISIFFLSFGVLVMKIQVVKLVIYLFFACLIVVLSGYLFWDFYPSEAMQLRIYLTDAGDFISLVLIFLFMLIFGLAAVKKQMFFVFILFVSGSYLFIERTIGLSPHISPGIYWPEEVMLLRIPEDFFWVSEIITTQRRAVLLILAILGVMLIGFLVNLIKDNTVKVPEAMAGIRMAPGGKFSGILMNWRGYGLAAEDDEEKSVRKGDIVRKEDHKTMEKSKMRIPKTNYFFLFPFYHNLYEYVLNLSKNHYKEKEEKKPKEEEGEEKEKTEKEKGDQVSQLIDLREQEFHSVIEKTTGGPTRGEDESDNSSFNRIDVTCEYFVIMRVKNLFSFAFDSPKNSFDVALERLDNLIGRMISEMEFNLLERLQGSNEAFWWGLVNPEKVDYEEIYPNINEDEEIRDLKEKHKDLWRRYKKDIGSSDDIDLIFKGLHCENLIVETLPKWGIEVFEEGVEIISVEGPPEIKEERKILAKKDILLEETKREKEIAKVMAEINIIDAEGIKGAYEREMSAVATFVDELIYFKNYDRNTALKIGQKMLESIMAKDNKEFSKKIIEGLEGGNIAGIMAQLGLGRGVGKSLLGENDGSKKNDPNKSKGKDKSSNKKEETYILDKDGNRIGKL